MTPTQLRTLTAAEAPKLPPLLHALWLAAHGDWQAAHEIAADATNDPANSAWLHAHLHREEGDSFNAGYWYRRAGKPVCTVNLEEEWQTIATAFLAS